METITIPKENARKAYQQAKGEFKTTLAILFGSDIINPNPIEAFGSYEKVCEAAGIHPVNSLPFPKPTTKKQVSANGNFKLQTIFDEFNRDENGKIWEPDYTSNEPKWYAWFEWSASAGGFVCTFTFYTYTYTLLGARLCTNTDAKMTYIAKTFIKEFNEFLNPQI